MLIINIKLIIQLFLLHAEIFS